MTNNPDSKAPERIQVEYEVDGPRPEDYNSWIHGFEYQNRDIRDFGYFEGTYILESAITPQQAAKVLLDAHEMTDYGAFGVNFSEEYLDTIKALAESKDD